jgi:hypothetical protein
MTYIYYPNQNIMQSPNTGGMHNLFQQSVQKVAQTSSVTLGEAFKPKRAGKTKSHIVFLLDDSGSMQSCRDATISGFNEYLQAQKIDSENTGIETFVSLYKFNGSSVTGVINKMPISEVQPLTRENYNPMGGTNLLDALGGVMMTVNTQLKENKKAKRESVIVTVLTDGEENASRSFANSDIKQMVEKAEAKSWGFMFLGANIDAFAASSKLGFNSANTMQYDTANMGATISAASAMTSRMRSAYSLGATTSAALYDEVGFTDAERNQATSTE